MIDSIYRLKAFVHWVKLEKSKSEIAKERKIMAEDIEKLLSLIDSLVALEKALDILKGDK